GDGFALVTLDPVGTARPGVRIVPVGRDSAIGHWLIRMNARAVLVRPDRVVCAVARRASDVCRLLPPAPPPAPTAQGARLNTEQPALGRRGLLAATGASAAALLAASACATPLSEPPSQPVSSPSTADESLIDLHAHFVTDTYVAAAVAAGHRTPDGMPSWPSWNVQAHMAVMDAARIEKSILSLSSPGVHFGDDDAARRLAREVNEFAAEVVRAHPSRFGHFAILPLPDVAGAVEEAAYALDHLGANGVAILSNAAGRYPGDTALDPLLAELNRRAAIVFVHPVAPPNAAAVARGRPLPLIEFLFDSARAAVDLVLSDRLSRFPRIRWIFTHGGGVLPLLTARIDLFASQSSGGRAFDSAAMLAKFWFDSAGTPFPSQLPALADAVGTGRIVYGSDFCFTPPPVVAAQVASIDAAR
ncbi:amidohydrolase family protein, partial [Nonomuraea fuscirosea]